MSISSVGGLGAITLGDLLSPYLSQANSTQSTASAAVSTASAAPSLAAGCSSSAGQANNLSGSGKGQISAEILALLVQMQQLVDGSQNTASTSAASTATSTIAASGTASTAGSTTTANPIASLYSAMGGTSGGSVSESQLESYIENLGGTQAQADQLYSQLTQSGSDSLTEQQLAQDVFESAPQGPPPPPSAQQLADGLIDAMGGSNGSVSKSEFEAFVTANGGTTSEADQDFAALDTSGSGSLTASDLENAIQNQQTTQGSASTSISPLLSWLDSLATTVSATTA